MWAVKILIGIVAIYLVAITGMVLNQRSLMYFPTAQFVVDPGQVKDLEVVNYPTADGLMLSSWYVPPQGDKPVIVLFHGNAGNLSYRIHKLQHFTAEGYGVLLAEYRGFGGNAGSPSEEGFYNDGRAVMDWLIKTRHIKESQIIVYGESIGSGTASEMAFEYKGIKALVLEAPFTSAVNEAADRYPFIGPFKYLVFDKFDNISKAPQFQMPVFVVQGSRDNVIPPTHGKALFDAVGSPAKKYVLLEGGGHTDLSDFGLFQNIDSFIGALK